MRVVLLASLLISAGCILNMEDVDFTFDNRTDSQLCFFSRRNTGGCPNEIKPRGETVWRAGCGDGPNADELPLTVVLTVAEEGRQIYERTEECRVWQKSDHTFVIDRREGEFVVTDGLP
jgi:hypothetical protein